jgi:peptidoglycan-associated lipoprotein
MAQTKQSTLAGRPNTERFGLCQCIADHSSRKLSCTPGAAKCESVCLSTLYSFVPLTQNALATCAPAELYVVFPNADGRPGSGAISVNQGGTTALLDQPYSAAAAVDGTAANIAVAPTEVAPVFDKALGARPILPTHFRLLFPAGSDRMVPELAGELRAIVADIKRRPVYEVDLVGHTDPRAGEARNRNLALNRANAVRQALMRNGIDPRTISTAGRAARDLPVSGAKIVGEQSSRRVDVTIR